MDFGVVYGPLSRRRHRARGRPPVGAWRMSANPQIAVREAPRLNLGTVLARHWPILLGTLVLIVPTIVSLAQEIWSTEGGIHGPIVLATGLWLITRSRPSAAIRPGSPVVTGLILVPMLLLYVFGRAFDFISIEVFGLLGTLFAIAYSFVGGAALRQLWFPILYLCFLIPLPNWLVDTVTAPLKTFVSFASIKLLSLLSYPVAREGVTIYIAQYTLLVADACAGLNSLISLTAISLFYVYLMHNSSWRYSLVLMAFIVPIAIAANVVRIIALVLITYYLGNDAGQGFLHSTAGLLMFTTALLGIFLVDYLMLRVFARLRRSGHGLAA